MSSLRYQAVVRRVLGPHSGFFAALREAERVAIAAVRDGALWAQLLRQPSEGSESTPTVVVATYLPLPCGSCPNCLEGGFCWLPKAILVDTSSQQVLA